MLKGNLPSQITLHIANCNTHDFLSSSQEVLSLVLSAYPDKSSICYISTHPLFTFVHYLALPCRSVTLSSFSLLLFALNNITFFSNRSILLINANSFLVSLFYSCSSSSSDTPSDPGWTSECTAVHRGLRWTRSCLQWLGRQVMHAWESFFAVRDYAV